MFRSRRGWKPLPQLRFKASRAVFCTFPKRATGCSRRKTGSSGAASFSTGSIAIANLSRNGSLKPRKPVLVFQPSAHS